MTRDEAIKALTMQLEYWEQLKEKNVLTDHEGNNVVDVLKMAIEALRAEPVKHGKWINRRLTKKDIRHLETYGELIGYHDICSVCGFDIDEFGMLKSPYCPNCGAKMDGDMK